MLGICKEYFWNMHEMSIESAWYKQEYAWDMQGICLEHAWITRRICLEYP